MLFREGSALQPCWGNCLRRGGLQARYYVNDPRHDFAVRLYQETRDVYAIYKALGHANVAVTEIYLRSLGVGDRNWTYLR